MKISITWIRILLDTANNLAVSILLGKIQGSFSPPVGCLYIREGEEQLHRLIISSPCSNYQGRISINVDCFSIRLGEQQLHHLIISSPCSNYQGRISKRVGYVCIHATCKKSLHQVHIVSSSSTQQLKFSNYKIFSGYGSSGTGCWVRFTIDFLNVCSSRQEQKKCNCDGRFSNCAKKMCRNLSMTMIKYSF